MQARDLSHYNFVLSLKLQITNSNQQQAINLSNNNLVELESDKNSLKDATSLLELNVSFNRLSRLPANLVHLQSLVHLNLSNNFLSELFPVLFELTNLKLLNADNNPISCIPNEVIKLTKLEELTLTHTEIDALPDNQETRTFVLQVGWKFTPL